MSHFSSKIGASPTYLAQKFTPPPSSKTPKTPKASELQDYQTNPYTNPMQPPYGQNPVPPQEANPIKTPQQRIEETIKKFNFSA
jgi:hypothetical protein